MCSPTLPENCQLIIFELRLVYIVCYCVKTEADSELCSLEYGGLEDRTVLSGACRTSLFTADSCEQYMHMA